MSRSRHPAVMQGNGAALSQRLFLPLQGRSMHTKSVLLAITAGLLASSAIGAEHFNRIASFPVGAQCARSRRHLVRDHHRHR